MPDFKNKRIIITGASQGLGAVAAKAFAERGAKLALLARNIDKTTALAKELSNSAMHHPIQVDLLEVSQIGPAIDKAITKLEGIDIVLHIAGGGLGLRDPLILAQDLIKLLQINLVAASEINRIVFPLLKKQQSGNLVHVGSIASYEAAGSVGYNTAKAALSAYVRSLGREVAGENIIVTGILPGGFFAPGNAMDRLQQSKPDVYKKFIEERLPRKKMGDADELIPLLLFLASSQASMMSGCLIPIDAGEGKAYQV